MACAVLLGAEEKLGGLKIHMEIKPPCLLEQLESLR